MMQSGVGVLFDQKNGGAFAPDRVDCFKDCVHHERRQTKRRLIE